MVAQRHEIILTTSVVGLSAWRGQATYAAAKSAVVGLMRILAMKCRAWQDLLISSGLADRAALWIFVRVECVTPSFFASARDGLQPRGTNDGPSGKFFGDP